VYVKLVEERELEAGLGKEHKEYRGRNAISDSTFP